MTSCRAAATAALVASLSALPARAEPPSSPSAQRTTGIAFTATGVALAGAGGYFVYRGNHDDDATSGRLGIALLAGGIITTGIGVVLWVGSSGTDSAPRQALRLEPNGASFSATF